MHFACQLQNECNWSMHDASMSPGLMSDVSMILLHGLVHLGADWHREGWPVYSRLIYSPPDPSYASMSRQSIYTLSSVLSSPGTQGIVDYFDKCLKMACFFWRFSGLFLCKIREMSWTFQGPAKTLTVVRNPYLLLFILLLSIDGLFCAFPW